MPTKTSKKRPASPVDHTDHINSSTSVKFTRHRFPHTHTPDDKNSEIRNLRLRQSTGDWLCAFWNVNSIRQRRQRGLFTNLDILNLDIVFLFETQCNIELFQDSNTKTKLAALIRIRLHIRT